MVFGKNKHCLSTTLCFSCKDPITNTAPIFKVHSIVKEFVPRTYNDSSTTTFDVTTIGYQSTQTEKCYIGSKTSFDMNTYVGNVNHAVGTFQSNFILGSNGLFDRQKLRCVTRIQVQCTSNINSNLLTLNTIDNTSKQYNACQQNFGGFVGFNIYRLNTLIQVTNVKKGQLANLQESLFKNNTYHRSYQT